MKYLYFNIYKVIKLILIGALMSAKNNSEGNFEKINEESLTDGINSQRLNLILAICGIVIALASFYATYLQAEAADKQVKAMTMPLIQFGHGNHDSKLNIKSIGFELSNSGMGPALIKSVIYKYQEKNYYGVQSFYNACCRPPQTDAQNSELIETANNPRPNTVTSILLNTILAGQESKQFLKAHHRDNDPEFWNKLNNARWKLRVEVCYCSMLDECYITEKNGVIDPIEQCPVIDR